MKGKHAGKAGYWDTVWGTVHTLPKCIWTGSMQICG